MDTRYIYIVGQPDPQSGTVDTIHSLGYKAGILSDTRRTLKNPEQYDHIEKVDFSNLVNEIDRLKESNLAIAGMVCTYENYIVSKAKLSEAFGTPSLSVESALLSTDKSRMRQAFINEDPSISPEFTTVDTVEEALAFASKYGYPLIIKPTNLVKSLLVLKCDNEEQLIERFTYAHQTIGSLYEKYTIYDRTPQLIIEEFIVGEQYSIAAFVDSNGKAYFCNGIVSLKNAQDIGVDDNYLYSRTLPADLSEDTAKKMFQVAETGIRALGMTSVPAHVELIVGPKGVKLVEIGARIGGYRPRMYRYSYGLDLARQEVKLAINEKPEVSGAFAAYSAVYELFSKTEGAFLEVIGTVDTTQFSYYRVVAKAGQQTGPAKNGYKAAAIIIVSHENEETFKNLCLQAEVLSIGVSA
ncbi:MAG: ATP-grasp domain-containing protein [Candidatus Saccharimonadaceae bacterium]